MKYLNVLHRLFHEDMGWLTTCYLPTPLYLDFFKKNYPKLHTHFSFVFPKTEEKSPISIHYTEIPFYNYKVDTPKKGYVNIPIDENIPELLEYVTELASFNTTAIERVHLKEDETKLYVELFLQESFDKLSDIQLCYYYYHQQIGRIRDVIKQHLYFLFLDENKKEKYRSY
ncbi:hypothetical protein, partial [Aquimarina longa]|uniref:hypothetical protein n=1 Tax=Aquimarina longa TaxID=1080221 RepID=UPI000AB7B44F